MKLPYRLLFLVSLSCSAYGSSGETLKQAEKAPLTIDSAKGLVCHKENMTCEAEGSVVVKKGPYTMESNRASATMKKGETGKTEISHVEAHDDVRFFGINGEKATADEAIYDLEAQSIDLSPGKGEQVVVWKDQYIMLSDELKIHFKQDPEQKTQIEKIVAKGHVALSSPDELVEGHHATFTPESKMILVTGDVRVNRKEGQLRGPAAEVNLDKKVSKMLKETGTSTSNRVRVYVYPEEVDKKVAKK